MQNGHAVPVSALRGRSALLTTRPRPLTARLRVIAGSDKPESSSGKTDADGDKAGLQMPAFLKPLTDFGVGKKSVWEGGVGLFVLTGIGTSHARASIISVCISRSGSPHRMHPMSACLQVSVLAS